MIVVLVSVQGGEPAQAARGDRPDGDEWAQGIASPSGEAPPPHWSVDFWVADVDAAASAKVTERGGKLVMPPYEVPNTGLREAVVTDPQGATLSLTQPPAAY